MKKTPCETLVWDVLPCIRRQLAEKLKEKGLSQRCIAEKIGVSEAAVSQYFSNKRGKNSSFSSKMGQEIRQSAEAVFDGADAIEEICHLCRIAKEEIATKDTVQIC
jgi:predicted transcriptional regulator